MYKEDENIKKSKYMIIITVQLVILEEEFVILIDIYQIQSTIMCMLNGTWPQI